MRNRVFVIHQIIWPMMIICLKYSTNNVLWWESILFVQIGSATNPVRLSVLNFRFQLSILSSMMIVMKLRVNIPSINDLLRYAHILKRNNNSSNQNIAYVSSLIVHACFWITDHWTCSTINQNGFRTEHSNASSINVANQHQ